MKTADYQDFNDRQERVLRMSGVPASVAIAMDCWADWMRQGAGVKGYPSGAVGFSSGGVRSFEDMDEAATNYAARSVDGAVQSLYHTNRTALGVVWLGHSIYFRRLDVERLAADALKVIHAGLVLRGVC